MCCLLLSLETTVRLSLHRVTRLLNSGTLLDNANTPLLKMDTLTGHLVCNSHPTPTHQSLFHVDGIKLSRYGTLLTALKTNHYGHTAFISAVTVSPDGSLCASGGKDGQAMLW